MSDGILTILKFCLLAIVYLFLLRVLFVVHAELKGSPAIIVTSGQAPPNDRRRRKSWTVSVVEPPSRAGSWAVEGELTIGRAGGCAIAIPDDEYVSQVHARIFERDGDAFVEDLGSTNGTLLNGELLTETVKLRRGDRVQVGSLVLEAAR